MRIILVIWLTSILALSISPLSFKLKLHTTGAYHNLGHYAVYALTGLLLWSVAETCVRRVIAFALGVGVAFGQEWLENRIYHAGFEWKDVATDLAGLITGFAVMLLITALTSDSAAQRSRARL